MKRLGSTLLGAAGISARRDPSIPCFRYHRRILLEAVPDDRRRGSPCFCIGAFHTRRRIHALDGATFETLCKAFHRLSLLQALPGGHRLMEPAFPAQTHDFGSAVLVLGIIQIGPTVIIIRLSSG